jgi:chromosome segregation ATPase
MAGVIERAVADIGRAAETASERVTEETAGVGKALIAGAAAAGEEANGAIKAAAERSAEALLAVADELQRSVRAMGSDLDRAAYEMREVDKSLLAYRDTIERVTGTARDTEAAMTGAARAIREASAPLTTAGQTMAASSRRIGDAIDKAVVSIQASEGHTRVLADRISTTLEQVSRTWADYEKRFAGVDKSLEDALGKIVGQVQTSMDIMHKYVLEIDGKSPRRSIISAAELMSFQSSPKASRGPPRSSRRASIDWHLRNDGTGGS